MRTFIAKIQNSDERTKKLWLAAFSAVSMIVVVGLWTVYVRVTIPSLAQTAQADTGEVAANAQPQTPGFFSVFAAGLKIIADKVQGVVASKVAEHNDIVIENQDQNFTLEGLPAIPPTKLR